nr:MAG: putative maturation protein [Leviviridae sp.]
MGTDYGTFTADHTYRSEMCVDENTTPGTDHPFYLEKFEDNLSPLDGVVTNHIWFNGSSVNGFRPGSVPGTTKQHLLVDNGIVAADFARVRSRSNPSRPVVTPLTLIQDVVELPKMLKDVGRLLKKGTKAVSAKELANQNLAVQFGWMPLVDDAKKLLNLQSYAIKRSREWNKLYSGSGLKRRLSLDSAHAESTIKEVPYWSDGFVGSCYRDLQKYTSSRKWGTIRWKPTSPPPYHESEADRNRRAMRVVAGMTGEGLAEGLWDVMPWTWLLDWFTGMGDYLGQNSNTVPARSERVNVMRQTVTSTNFIPSKTVLNATYITGGEGHTVWTTKERSQNSSVIITAAPFLSVRRLSILGSLFVQRFK